MSQGYIANPYSPERSIYGRAGRVLRNGTWLANVTEISATMTIDRMEVRRAGDYWVQYKAGEFTGEGSLSFDKVNSLFESEFINYINGTDSSGAPLANRALPVFNLMINLEDRGIPNIQFDENGEAISGHESIILNCVNFWSLPVGYTMTDLLSRDMDFTFRGIQMVREIVDPPNVDVTAC